MAKGWLKAIAQTPALRDRLEIVGLVDLSPEAAQALAKEFSLEDVTIGTDLDEVLATVKPDFLFDIVVPEARHQIVATALRRGIHVLSEKPMGTSMEEARALIDLADSAKRTHAIVQNRRFVSGVRRMRQFIEDGTIGDLTAVHCDFFIGAHFDGFRNEMEHVLLLDMAIHTFDAARYVSDKAPIAVYCYENNPAGSWYRTGAAANAIFEFSDNVTFTYRGSWCAEGASTSWESAWRLVGTKGTLIWDGADAFDAHIVTGDTGFFRTLETVNVSDATDPDQTHGHASVLCDFVQSIETGTSPETVGSDNIKSLAMVFGAIQSAQTGQRVEISI